jgi:hypothetical protein
MVHFGFGTISEKGPSTNNKQKMTDSEDNSPAPIHKTHQQLDIVDVLTTLSILLVHTVLERLYPFEIREGTDKCQ